VSVASLWARTAADLFLNNVVANTVCPVVGALLVGALRDPTPAESADPVAAAVVFAVYLPVNFLDFILVVGYLSLRDGQSFRTALDRLYRPVIPWEITTGAVVAGTVIAYQEIGLLAVGLLGILLATQSSLLRAVLAVERQRDELRELVNELVGLQRGVVRVLVETLSLRDQMTARHSAAVARFARATAQAATLPEREQELVRIAGLLHDVGKFTFPDRTLTSRELSDEDWALIRSHPQRGADIVRRVRGYAEVADLILCHHERMDGRGYPRGLAGEDIPVLARIISIADTFDVMTARDSYRTPIAIPDAIVELRRVAGTQLDAELVEVFVDVIEGGRVGFTHADNQDLEEELTYERREQAPEERGRLRRRPASAATS
jgi:putative nucleotidyltransferase with HDIG domain